MNNPEEMVTVEITRKEAERVMAGRQFKPHAGRFIYMGLAVLVAVMVVAVFDAPMGSPPGTHNIHGLAAPGTAAVAGGIWLFLVQRASWKADRLGRERIGEIIKTQAITGISTR
jgi:hypothetical protein